MQKIIPHLWFDKEAVEATTFYTSIFPNSSVKNVNKIKDTLSGDCDIVTFNILGLDMMAISAGPYFKPSSAISFMINFDPSTDTDARGNLDRIWNQLIVGGKIMMPLDKYPFSEHYGWVEDRYGYSWQLILTNPNGEPRPSIMPSLLFVKDNFGKAKEATDYYLSLFGDSKRGSLAFYPEENTTPTRDTRDTPRITPQGEGTNAKNNVMFTDFTLANQWFTAMDGAGAHDFKFTEALSFIVNCDTQEEIDHFWSKLSHVPEAEQCGWCKDEYGVSWQIVPRIMNDMMSKGTPEQSVRVTKAFLQMKKFDIKKLEAAYNA